MSDPKLIEDADAWLAAAIHASTHGWSNLPAVPIQLVKRLRDALTTLPQQGDPAKAQVLLKQWIAEDTARHIVEAIDNLPQDYNHSWQERAVPLVEQLLAAQDPSAPFESFRQYLDDAVAQLTKEMAEQQIAYALPPTDDITALIRACAKADGRSVWQTWRSWAMRHLVPIQWIIDRSAGELTHGDLNIMNKRLRDVLGYVVLGLVLCERRTKERP